MLDYFINKIALPIMTFIMSVGFRWIVYMTVFILSFVSYYHNPIRFSENISCMGFDCRWFNFVTMALAVANYLFGLIALWYMIPFSKVLPDYWYILVIIISYAVLVHITIETETRHDDGTFNPPPGYLMSKKQHITLYWIIFVLDLIVFIQLYIEAGTSNSDRLVNLLDKYIFSRFGGYIGDRIQFLIGWFGLAGLVFDLMNIRALNNYNACAYNLPKSWNF